jgi:signal transduction histidine kinase
MKARTRITLALAVALVVAGSLALAVHALALGRADYPAWDEYRDELLAEMDVSHQGALRALEQDPALLFDPPPGEPLGPNGVSVEEASVAVQRRAVDRATARSRQWAGAAFVVVATASLGLAWLLAGRLLRPVRLVTERARAASGDDLSMRVALAGPPDEIKDLADTFDAMLDRLERSFRAQRRFSAQVAHELRTPLAVCRSEVDMLLDDHVGTALLDGGGPDVGPELTRGLERVADATRRADRLVTQLHVLARTDRHDLCREAFPLDELVGNVVGRVVEAPAWQAIRVDLTLATTPVVGDRALLESLVRNLVDNAGRHNRPGGWARVTVLPAPDVPGAELHVANSTSGTAPTGDVAAGAPGNANVGLTIVRAVLDAHEGTITWRHDIEQVTAVVRLPSPAQVLAVAGPNGGAPPPGT